MKTPSLLKSSLFVATLMAGLLAVPSAHAEGEVGSQAFQWSGLSDLAPSNPQTYSLSSYQGKVVLLVVFQYSCSGCLANAPKIGRLVDTLDRSPDSAKFQAVGTEIFNGSYSQIQSYRLRLTDSSRLAINFPSVHVVHDTAIAANDGTGEKWKRYNSYRDVYFVIDHSGKITARVDGNRGSAMSNTQYNTLRTALNTAIAGVPVSIKPSSQGAASGLKVLQRGGAFVFEASAFHAPVSLKIVDLQGRTMRSIVASKTASIIWDGKDATGKAVPFGTYFVRATDGALSMTQRITVLP